MDTKELLIKIANWDRDKADIIAVRHEVFVKEQNVPPELEQDGKDSSMIHVLVLKANDPIGTARMDHEGHIGRVAVLKEHRGKKIGVRIMNALEKAAREASFSNLELNAQTHAAGFYEGLGYSKSGKIFEEAGISHIRMHKKL